MTPRQILAIVATILAVVGYGVIWAWMPWDGPYSDRDSWSRRFWTGTGLASFAVACIWASDFVAWDTPLW